jgi:hypothetical protein
MTWHDYARNKLAVFTREEARAIVAYLEWKRDCDETGLEREEIGAALDGFWRSRSLEAPLQATLRRHITEEAEYLNHLNSLRP